MKSKTTGRDYRVSVALPESYYTDGERRYPVLVVSDANICFGTAVNTTRMLAMVYEIPELIVIGLDNPVDTLMESTLLRNRDLTPSRDAELDALMKQVFGDDTEIGTGEGSRHLAFLRDEILPFIDTTYRTTTDDRSYFGTSLGGLFGTYVMFQNPDLFQSYILGSPSYWYDSGIAFRMEKDYGATHTDLPARVFLAVGALEEIESDPRTAERKMVTNTAAMHEALLARAYPSLSLSHTVFEDETHYSVIGAIVSRGIRTVSDRPEAPEWA